VGGHLLGRIELGAFGLILSMASASLVLAAALWLAKSMSRRAAIILAITIAMAFVSGHGYLQLGLIALVPAFQFMIIDKNWKLRPVWREYLLAGLLSIMLAGFFLIPLLHFAPNIEKFTDPDFGSAQTLAYIPLNLVVRDWDFMNAEILGKLPYPYLYNLFIGWWPVIFAVLSLYFLDGDDRHVLLTLLAGIPSIFFVASGIPFRWLVGDIPILAGFRHVPLIAGLAIPPILGLAAYSFDCILWKKWPEIHFIYHQDKPKLKLSLRFLLLLPAIGSIATVYSFNQRFLSTFN
jgi:hypothetical protein